MAGANRNPSPAAAPEDHGSAIKTPQQLIAVVLAAFLVPVIGILLIVEFVVSGPKHSPALVQHDAVAARIKPVGELSIDTAAAPPATDLAPIAAAMAAIPPGPPANPGTEKSKAPGKVDGKAVYDQTCMICHAAGISGAPKTGDAAVWAPRLKTGKNALYASALKGKNQMPAKGGNASLSDAQVKAAVDYLVAQVK